MVYGTVHSWAAAIGNLGPGGVFEPSSGLCLLCMLVIRAVHSLAKGAEGPDRALRSLWRTSCWQVLTMEEIMPNVPAPSRIVFEGLTVAQRKRHDVVCSSGPTRQLLSE